MSLFVGVAAVICQVRWAGKRTGAGEYQLGFGWKDERRIFDELLRLRFQDPSYLHIPGLPYDNKTSHFSTFSFNRNFSNHIIAQLTRSYFLSGMPRSFRNLVIALFSPEFCSLGKPPCLPPSMVMNSVFTPASCNFL